MYGLENRLKTKESISRKIDKKSKENKQSLSKSAKEIKDAIRFTAISSTDKFVSSYEKIKKELEKKGYKETECTNYFNLFNEGKVKHKAVQSNFKTKDGYEFEIQFQTPESQKAKTKKIPLYEERRKVGIDPKRAKELEKQMEDLALKVPDPHNVNKIKTHYGGGMTTNKYVFFNNEDDAHEFAKQNSDLGAMSSNDTSFSKFRFSDKIGDKPYVTMRGSNEDMKKLGLKRKRMNNKSLIAKNTANKTK